MKEYTRAKSNRRNRQWHTEKCTGTSGISYEKIQGFDIFWLKTFRTYLEDTAPPAGRASPHLTSLHVYFCFMHQFGLRPYNTFGPRLVPSASLRPGPRSAQISATPCINCCSSKRSADDEVVLIVVSLRLALAQQYFCLAGLFRCEYRNENHRSTLEGTFWVERAYFNLAFITHTLCFLLQPTIKAEGPPWPYHCPIRLSPDIFSCLTAAAILFQALLRGKNPASRKMSYLPNQTCYSSESYMWMKLTLTPIILEPQVDHKKYALLCLQPVQRCLYSGCSEAPCP